MPLLVAEVLLVYLAGPLVMDQLAGRGLRYLLFPGMWLIAALVVWRSARLDPTFWPLVWTLPKQPAVWWAWSLRTLCGVALLAALASRLVPEHFLALPKRMFGLWLLIAVLYPLLSVVPQGFIFRAAWSNLYAPGLQRNLGLSEGTVFVLGVATFAFAHVIFRNSTALIATAVGGALFLYTYKTTGSLMLSNLEHAIYGLSAFTFGLGQYLYLGAARQ